ncbi:MAG TPA: ArsR family transcriptional regulator, partial [Acidimicrobiia bacterium]|nr:ArsR family transcriptional regulator [Acidimicrobiia bacterium]
MVEQKAEVRDLTRAPRQLPIEVDGAVVYEILLTLWTAFNPEERNTSFEMGDEWYQRVRESTPADLAEEIERLGGPHCGVWLAVMGLMSSAPHPHEPEQVYDWLEQIEPRRLRRWLLGYACGHSDAALIEEAANGDEAALRELLDRANGEAKTGHMISLLQIPEEELPARIADVLRRFRGEVFSEFEPELAGAIARAAAARRATVVRDSAKAVIEDVTRGLDYEIPLGVTRVVLVPSVVLRPLSLIDQQRETLLVMYAVADEFLEDDPEAPPSWLVRTYKALSDEKRLRILRRLGEGEATLDDLASVLGLAKSTVHHHIAILR